MNNWGGRVMYFIVFLLIVLIFAGIPVINHFEEKEIKEQDKDEKIIAKIKQHTGWKKITVFIIIGLFIFFFVNPSKMTLEMGIMKVMLILGIYIIDDFMKIKIYFSNKGVYVVEHIRNKQMIFAKMLQPGDIISIEKHKKNSSLYTIGYYGKDNLVTHFTFHLNDSFESEILEKKLNKLLRKPLSLEVNERFTQFSKDTWADKITRWFIWSMFFFSMIGVIKSFSSSYEHLSFTERLFTNVIAIWFIPFTLYFFSFFFLKARNIIRQKGLPLKKMSISFIVASSTIAVIPFIKNEQIDGIRFLKVELIGITLFVLIILFGYVTGKLYTFFNERRKRKSETPNIHVERKTY